MAKEKTLTIEPIKKTLIVLDIVGKDNLVLHKKDRCFERREVFKQTHDDGTAIPRYLNTNNIWQYLITGVHWMKPIEFHDDDPELYSEEELADYLTNNKPCIPTYAFKKGFEETFKSFGFKESTGKAGTDFSRTVSFLDSIVPITFESHSYNSKIVPTKGAFGGNTVVCHENVFFGWSTQLSIIIPNGVFPVDTIVSLAKTSGEFIGIGSRRKHGFGRYEIPSVSIDENYETK